ncbi:MAG TPA: gamma-glutamyltransferase [Phycisphaerae bacterium]|nr:gamma-glutamyltransferase [Phycisphaerae bacterium]HNU44101.1 gamma-glutamyltransferase [Phycisphaerae bacterium]
MSSILTPVLLPFVSVCLVAFGAQPGDATSPDWLAVGTQAMVASDSAPASQAGLRILQAGGNAVDAAAAVSFALGVTRPESTGLGGGGFMLVRWADGRVCMLDYREVAPAAATPDMFSRPAGAEGGEVPPPSRYGPLAVAVPGTLAGWEYALRVFGSKPLPELLAPAITLAEDGFALDAHYLDNAADALKTYQKHPGLQQSCAYVWRTFLGSGTLPRQGDMLRRPALAKLLRLIAQDGAGCLHHGPVAAQIEATVRAAGGILTRDDLERYEVRRREPLRCRYRDYTVLTVPPPSSGGTAIIEGLKILETFDLPRLATTDPALTTHVQIEALKHAFADRARWLGDPDFGRVPVERLTSAAYARRLAARIDVNRTKPPDDYGTADAAELLAPPVGDDGGTSHFCVVDKAGNVVVATETINTEFGSLLAVEEYGLILNNEMDDFTAVAGAPNAFGLIQGEANAVAPGKRPLSSMSPTIVLKDNEPVLLVGASGGPRIITSVFHVMLCLLDYGRSPEEAMTSCRPHQQWSPDEVCFDHDPPASLAAALQQRGHHLADKRRTGIVQFILRRDGTWIGASDPRKGGRPAGY